MLLKLNYNFRRINPVFGPSYRFRQRQRQILEFNYLLKVKVAHITMIFNSVIWESSCSIKTLCHHSFFPSVVCILWICFLKWGFFPFLLQHSQCCLVPWIIPQNRQSSNGAKLQTRIIYHKNLIQFAHHSLYQFPSSDPI